MNHPWNFVPNAFANIYMAAGLGGPPVDPPNYIGIELQQLTPYFKAVFLTRVFAHRFICRLDQTQTFSGLDIAQGIQLEIFDTASNTMKWYGVEDASGFFFPDPTNADAPTLKHTLLLLSIEGW